MKEKKFIDVEQLIGSKNPKALKRMPKFVIRYLKRILHQDDINEFIDKNQDRYDADFCDAAIEYLNIKIEVKNLDKVPIHGKVVIAMNHPLGGMDALILVSALRGKRDDLKFIVNDLLMNMENLKGLFVGVNKHGRNTSSLREQINLLFESDQAVCIFPAGMVSRRTKGKIQDFEWKKTFVTQAKRTGQDIIPVYIDGRLGNFFYNLSSFRRFFRIKMNIEMLYLSNELFKQHNKTMRFVIGEPIKNSELFEYASDEEAAQGVRAIVYRLKNQL